MNEAVVRLLERPGVYLAWQRPFVASKLAPVWRHNDRSTIRRVLDVGCGPGTNSAEFSGLDYLGVDLNPSYIEHARRRHGPHFEVADVRTDAVPGRGDVRLRPRQQPAASPRRRFRLVASRAISAGT